MFGVGASVVVMGRLCDVVYIAHTGDVQVRDVITLELRWYDYFVCRLLDPHENPGALLEAMSTLRNDCEKNDARDARPNEETDRGPPTSGRRSDGPAISPRGWSSTDLSAEGSSGSSAGDSGERHL